MENNNKPIDREMKVLLLNVLKKGYFDKKEIEILGKWIVFDIPISAWLEYQEIKKCKK